MQAKPTPGTQVNRVRGSVRRAVVSRPLEARIVSEGNHQPISATPLSRVEPHKVESSTPTVASQLEEAYAKGFEAGQKAAASSQSVRIEGAPTSRWITSDETKLLAMNSAHRSAYQDHVTQHSAAGTSRKLPGCPMSTCLSLPVQEVLHDSVMRTAVKSLTWRVLSTATTMALALFLFKDSIAADAAVELGVVEFVSKYGLYFIHERLWAAIAFIL